MKVFCMKCGAENTFATAAKRPDECGKCGNAFATSLNKPKKQVEEGEEPEDEGDVYMPDFRVSVSSTEEGVQTIKNIVHKNA